LTPLTSVSSQLEIALNREREPAEYKMVMASVYQDVHRLGKLTQTLLEFAKASGDPGGLEIDLVRVDEILFSLPREMTKLSEAYVVTLTFGELPEEDEKLLVFGNEALLFTAIKNIVINACKYSDDHKTEVKLSCHQNVITISIKDEGRGIPAADRENIFQPFYRAGEKNLDKGFGLGLSLAQEIIKLHKGQISLESVVNKGTVFSIMLPSAGSLLQDK
jgi:signal transduction histidine kinase